MAFRLFPDVCDECARYDWGRWHIARVVHWGFVVGVLVALFYAFNHEWSTYRFEWVVLMFWLLVGGVVGAAAADALTSWLFDRFLMQSPVREQPEERRQEAEKFFYLGMLSAFQGKNQYALRMLELARRHGWDHWERLTEDPRFRGFCARADVKQLVESVH